MQLINKKIVMSRDIGIHGNLIGLTLVKMSNCMASILHCRLQSKRSFCKDELFGIVFEPL